jgi:phosphatidylserine/phosphatidylglycerophosphate/cardiolipin synthase-like enzyme
VQVLRTYAIEKCRGYSWSDQGEFTVWASYLNAIKQARQYIYIEDQCVYTFGHPPAIEAPKGNLRDSDPVFQLGEALKRGVDVVVLVPSRSEDFGARYQLHQRGKAAHYLYSIADSSPHPVGRFVICFLRVGSKDPVVHSKLMIVDDEFVLIGSANVGQRRMSYDSEIQLGIVDSAHLLARNLRLALWKEHMELSDTNDISDPFEGVSNFRDNAISESGHLRIFSTADPGSAPLCHRFMMNYVIDPYKGPKRS